MPKLTRQQSAAKKMNLLKMDLLSILDVTSERFPTPYSVNQPIEERISDTINTITQFMAQSHRIAILINLYYLGELLSNTTNSRQTWRNYLKNQILPNHGRYYRAAIRIYEIFKGNRLQIYRTKHISMHYIAGMTNEDYNNDFLPYARNVGSVDFAF
jgi:hypothetical protein